MNQHFPQRCHDCRALFESHEWVVKLGVLYEGEYVTIGHRCDTERVIAYQFPGTDPQPPAERGRLLWAIWLCVACASSLRWRGYGVPEGRYQPPEVLARAEPDEVRRQRESAERSYARSVRQRSLPIVGARSHSR